MTWRVPAEAFNIASGRTEHACGCASWLQWHHESGRWRMCWARSHRCTEPHSAVE